jgi:membrane-bound serine protease (ClpP class)
LLDTDVPGFAVSPWVIAALASVGAGVFLTVFTLMNKARHRPVVSGPEEMLNSVGSVIDWQGTQGRVRVHGEIWQARSDQSLSPEMPVRVASRDGLVLTVRKASDTLTEGLPS